MIEEVLPNLYKATNHDDETCMRILRAQIEAMGDKSFVVIDEKVLLVVTPEGGVKECTTTESVHVCYIQGVGKEGEPVAEATERSRPQDQGDQEVHRVWRSGDCCSEEDGLSIDCL